MSHTLRMHRRSGLSFLLAMTMGVSVFSPSSSEAKIRTPSTSPVILVHGIGDNERAMARLGRHLGSQGREVHAFALKPNWGQAGLEELAKQLSTYATHHIPAGQKFDLIGFSMGGLVSRYYVQRLGGIDRVNRFITVSSPHAGTWVAYLLPNKGCRQMRPGSPFLRDLATDADQLARVHFTSFWTPLDLIILPARSSVVPGAECRKLWCMAHPLMINEPRCIRAIAAALSPGG